MTKTIQRLKQTDALPPALPFIAPIAPITTARLPAHLPVTMTIDDELARLRGMVEDLRRLNENFADQYDQHARVKAERDDLRRENEALRAALARAER